MMPNFQQEALQQVSSQQVWASSYSRVVCGILLTLVLSGCQTSMPGSATGTDSGPTRIPSGVLSQPDPVPSDEALSASGNSLSYVVFGKRYYRLASARNFDETGVASWYGRKFHGRLTASGEPYDMYSMTAAHKSIPLPAFARVTNLANNRSVVVRINDRGPFVGDRLIDLSYAAAAKLDMLNAGTANVRVVTLSGVPDQSDIPLRAAVAQPVSAAKPFVKPYAEPRPILSVSSPGAGSSAAMGSNPAIGLGAAAEQRKVAAEQSAAAEQRKVAAEPKVLANSAGRFLQIGAYGSFAAADELRIRVDGSVTGAVFVSKMPSSALFRVRVGPFATDAELAAARGALLERHSIDAIVVVLAEAKPTCC